ncbi:MAG TPA: hypothetical protein DEV98_09200 [Clostridiales bacterium]|nr:hypothetical protein [Clostridiales bacterium]
MGREALWEEEPERRKLLTKGVFSGNIKVYGQWRRLETPWIRSVRILSGRKAFSNKGNNGEKGCV